MQSNLDSWENLRQNLIENNLDINAIPLVIQYNKRDLPNVLPVKDLNKRINVLQVPFFEAIALTGMGVQETFKGIAKLVMSMLSKKYGKPEEVGAAVQSEPAEKVKVAIPVSVAPAPSVNDETLDLADLEEVQELPQVEELEMTEEANLHLEPVEIREKKPVPEKRVESLSMDVLKEEPSVKQEPQRPVQHASPRARIEPTPAARIENSETELIPDETVHASHATVSADQTNQEIPIEISVRREGQDIKLNISIHLRIRVDND
jgi:hypothetical protein